MLKPKITKAWNPGVNRTGAMTMLVDSGHERHYQTINWYVADDEEAAANARFYGAAQKMAEAMNDFVESDDCQGFHDRFVEILREAGYTDTSAKKKTSPLTLRDMFALALTSNQDISNSNFYLRPREAAIKIWQIADEMVKQRPKKP